ncbi:MAG: SDR family oxidoreductase [Gammaproteobacteria bacterium]|nr:SDR family oxidoreductase [Gammaproteobacteria bacterium]
MTKVLYIGGSGEISTACVAHSLFLGHDVSVFNRGNHPIEDVRSFKGSVYEPRPYQALANESFDVVCQFLAFDTKTVEEDARFFSSRCRQYVFISTASAYEKPCKSQVITEQTPLSNPHWEYSRKKIACEAVLMRQAQLPYTIVRPSHTYRSRLPGAVIDGNHQTWRLLNGKPVIVHDDGQSLWTLTHAEDFARALCCLFLNDQALGKAFHITDDQAHTWNKLIISSAKVLGVEAEIVHVSSERLVHYEPQWQGPLLGDKSNSMIFDNQYLKQVIGDWQCEVALEFGLQQTATMVLDRLAAGYEPDKSLDALVDRIIEENTSQGCS